MLFRTDFLSDGLDSFTRDNFLRLAFFLLEERDREELLVFLIENKSTFLGFWGILFPKKSVGTKSSAGGEEKPTVWLSRRFKIDLSTSEEGALVISAEFEVGLDFWFEVGLDFWFEG